MGGMIGQARQRVSGGTRGGETVVRTVSHPKRTDLPFSHDGHVISFSIPEVHTYQVVVVHLG